MLESRASAVLPGSLRKQGNRRSQTGITSEKPVKNGSSWAAKGTKRAAVEGENLWQHERIARSAWSP